MLRTQDYITYIKNSKRPILLITNKNVYIVPTKRRVTESAKQYGGYLVIDKATRIGQGRCKVESATNVVIDPMNITHCQSISVADMNKVFKGE